MKSVLTTLTQVRLSSFDTTPLPPWQFQGTGPGFHPPVPAQAAPGRGCALAAGTELAKGCKCQGGGTPGVALTLRPSGGTTLRLRVHIASQSSLGEIKFLPVTSTRYISVASSLLSGISYEWLPS